MVTAGGIPFRGITSQSTKGTALSVDSDFWDQCYAEGKTGWDRGEVHPALRQWVDMDLLKPCSIIVPGCGRGYEVVELATRGFDVVAIDIAAEPIQSLQKQLESNQVTAQVVRESIFEFQPKEPVDAVYEQTCLCAISPAMRTQYERSVFRWMRPGGALFALFAQLENPSDGPPNHCSFKDMKATFPETRWLWATDQPSRFEHPSGKLHELGYVLTRRN